MKNSELQLLEQSKLELAAVLGHQGARKLLGKKAPKEPESLKELRIDIEGRGFTPVALANIALVSLAISKNEKAKHSPTTSKKFRDLFGLLRQGLAQAQAEALIEQPLRAHLHKILETRQLIKLATFALSVSVPAENLIRSHLLMVGGLLAEIGLSEPQQFERAIAVAQIHFRETCKDINDKEVMQAVREKILPWALK